MRSKTVTLSTDVNVSIATTKRLCKRSQFVHHVTTLSGKSYDGHTYRLVLKWLRALLRRVLNALRAACPDNSALSPAS